MEKSILSISGRPGLYLLLSRSRSTLIVETVDEQKKRLSVGLREKISSLNDISIYTDEEDVPLMKVFENLFTKTEGKPISINVKEAGKAELSDFLASILPSYDRERVYPNDIKKIINWFNILVNNGYTKFDTEKEPSEEKEK